MALFKTGQSKRVVIQSIPGPEDTPVSCCLIKDAEFTFVSPAIGATLQTFLERRVLITELFPTFGYPMKPTLICFLSVWSCER